LKWYLLQHVDLGLANANTNGLHFIQGMH